MEENAGRVNMERKLTTSTESRVSVTTVLEGNGQTTFIR